MPRPTPRHAARPSNPAPSDTAPADTAPADVALLDNRGLEPPQPMLRTLEALEALPAGSTLEIHNDRIPVFLLPVLDDQAATYVVTEQPDGSARVRITKRAGS